MHECLICVEFTLYQLFTMNINISFDVVFIK